MSLGDFLKITRQNNGLSQENLSSLLNVSRQSISSWENDKTYPSLDNLIELSKIYDVSIDDLLKENEELFKKIDANNKSILAIEKKKNDLFEDHENDVNLSWWDELVLFLSISVFSVSFLGIIGAVIPIVYLCVNINDWRKNKSEN